MKSSTKQDPTRWHETMRVIAVLFLLLATADLAFPQVCGEDSEPLFPQREATATYGHADAAGDPLPHRAPAEDCFCCCSHIVAEDSASPLSELTTVSDSGRVPLPSVPATPALVLFHPPRPA